MGFAVENAITLLDDSLAGGLRQPLTGAPAFRLRWLRTESGATGFSSARSLLHLLGSS
jgi:hypothetical protein